MIVLTFTDEGHQRMCNLAGIFSGRTAILMGGAPTIKGLPLEKLEQRGVLSCAINNAARHFRPVLWFSADHPDCFEPQILLDPGIMKFSPAGHSGTTFNGEPMRRLSNVFFYLNEADVPVGRMFAERARTPWYHNTLTTSLVLLNYLGVTRIILGGSDFEFGCQTYAHEDGLTDRERELNTSLYTSQIYTMRAIAGLLKESGIELLDCSTKSKLEGYAERVSFDEAVGLALEGFPDKMADSKRLPHGTRFAPPELREKLNIPSVPVGQIGDGMEELL